MGFSHGLKVQDLPPFCCAPTEFVEKAISGQRFAGSPLRQRIVQLYGDSAVFDYGPYLEGIDLVFIDGSHSYDYVRNDLEKAFLLLRRRPAGNSRGIILLHDYGAWEGVTRAAEELRRTDPRFSALKHLDNTTLAFIRFE